MKKAMIPEVLKALRSFIFGRLSWKSTDVPDGSDSWGNGIQWKNLDAAAVDSHLARKPMMLISYLPGCPACNALKSSISTSKDIVQISPFFVMTLINEFDLPQREIYYPDGMAYVPRVLFFDHKGILMPQYYNRLGNPTRKYFYPNDWSLYNTMVQVKNDYKNR